MLDPVDLASFRDRVVVADGAWGTELQRRGLVPGEPADLWNLTHPDQVRDVARSHAGAGSRIVTTNTFGANRVTLRRHGLGDQAAAMAEAGARLSREGAGRDVLVFGSMGPTASAAGASELVDAFTEQALALRRGGAQAIVVETMTDVTEAAIAVRCAAAAGLQVVACFTFGWGEDGCSTAKGVTPARAVEEMVRAGARALGANCGTTLAEFERVVALYRQTWSGPIWVKPGAGLPRLVDGSFVYDLTPHAFAESVVRIVAAGANIVGGCCGVTPELIRALSARFGSAGGGPTGPAPRST